MAKKFLAGIFWGASAEKAVMETVKNLTAPTPKGKYFSVAVSSDGSYNTPEGLMIGFPICSDGQSWSIVQGIKHNEFAQEKIKATIAELIEERDAVTTVTRES